MKYLFPPIDRETGKLQSRLMRLAAIFLVLTSLAITLTPAVRLHSWDASFRFNHWIGFFVWLIVFSWIHYQISRKLIHIDPFILPVTSLLTGWGLLSIWRLDPYFGLRQSIWLVIGGVIFTLAIRYPVFLKYLRRYKYVWLFSGLLLTGITFVLGTYPDGAAGPNLWLNFGGIYLQPSEPLKLLLIIYLAAYFADQTAHKLKRLQLLAPTIILIAAAVFLLVAQRDLGTALVFLLIYFIIAFIVTGDKWILVLNAVFLVSAGLLGYRLYGVIQQRIDTWLNPWLDPTGTSYQIIQSLIATASGGVFGRGPGLGNPALVPIAHSDFIFSSIAEEYGLIGTFAILLLFIILTFRAFIISIYAPNYFRRYLSAGLGVYFTIQSVLIIGGNLNLLPLSGITLPFVSYGGSSLLVSISAVAILAIISDQIETEMLFVPKTRPYLVISSLFLGLWMLIAMINGYWTFFRSDELILRSDNLRLAINDLYVPRGNFLDRNNNALTQTVGERGEFFTTLLYPQLSNVIGFSSMTYGQAGLQAALDPYLRGLQGNPSSLIWSHSILFAQRPPGLDVRLSLDINLQNLADEMLAGQNGAVVLMNAQTGEILTMASSPNFNANQLEENWETWQTDPESPFLNRATLGRYYPETAFAPFILYKALENDALPAIPQQQSYTFEENIISCATAPQNVTEWREVISSGCPGAVMALVETLSPEAISSIYGDLGFYTAPEIELPVSEPDNVRVGVSTIQFYVNNIYATPLQMALAASTYSSGGYLPEPSLVLAVKTPHQGWVILSQGSSSQSLSNLFVEEVVELLSTPDTFYWHVTSFGDGADDELTTWFIGGTTHEWQGSPLAVAVVLESESPSLAEEIGFGLLEATINPPGQ